jgi:RNA polymerase-binding transcription factor DksA
MSNSVNRYSDTALEEFRVIVQQRLDKAKEQLEQLQAQIYEITESSEDGFGTDWVDDSHTNTDMEMLNDMAIRQRKYMQDLENALIRIKNKTYGICVVTGELIDKKRLVAVPTTTKSMAGKMAQQQPVKPAPAVPDEDEDEKPKKKKPSEPKIIEKVIRKGGSKPKVSSEEEDLAFMRDLGLEDEDDIDENNDSYEDDNDIIDPDSLADPEEDF